MHICNLPKDCVLEIIRNLRNKTDILALSCTCRYFYKLGPYLLKDKKAQDNWVTSILYYSNCTYFAQIKYRDKIFNISFGQSSRPYGIKIYTIKRITINHCKYLIFSGKLLQRIGFVAELGAGRYYVDFEFESTPVFSATLIPNKWHDPILPPKLRELIAQIYNDLIKDTILQELLEEYFMSMIKAVDMPG